MLGKTNASNKPPVYFVILGTMPTTSGTWTNYYSFPNGWTDISKIRLLNLEILANDTT